MTKKHLKLYFFILGSHINYPRRVNMQKTSFTLQTLKSYLIEQWGYLFLQSSNSYTALSLWAVSNEQPPTTDLVHHFLLSHGTN